MAMSDRWRMSPTLRMSASFVSIACVVIAGAKVIDQDTAAGSGFSTIATVNAEPTGGPTGGPGGPDGMSGGAFQPPGLPPQMPNYQGGINQPPLDQNAGVSIYNTGSPGAQQIPGQQGAQQPQQRGQTPQHGSQIPDYQSNPGYTQGPGKPNPDAQAPQQVQPSQAPQQQQPSQAPTQTEQPEQPRNKQDDTTRQLDDEQQRQQRCMAALLSQVVGGGGSLIAPGRDPIFQADGSCSDCDEENPKQFSRNCEQYTYKTPAKMDRNMPCGYIYDPDSKKTPKEDEALHDYCTAPTGSRPSGNDFSYACARHDMCYAEARKVGDGLGPCNDVFKKDMYSICGHVSGFGGTWCRRVADSYWAVVVVVHTGSN